MTSLPLEALSESDRQRVAKMLEEAGVVAVQALDTGEWGKPLLMSIREPAQVRMPTKWQAFLRSQPREEHWAGDRNGWRQTLSVYAWMRGVVEFPEIGAWQCPRL